MTYHEYHELWRRVDAGELAIRDVAAETARAGVTIRQIWWWESRRSLRTLVACALACGAIYAACRGVVWYFGGEW